MGVKRNQYSKFKQSNMLDIPDVAHMCNVKFKWSSGAMELSLAFSPTTKIFDNSDGHVYIEYIVIDDDSTMIAYCRNIVNEGKLSDHIP